MCFVFVFDYQWEISHIFNDLLLFSPVRMKLVGFIVGFPLLDSTQEFRIFDFYILHLLPSKTGVEAFVHFPFFVKGRTLAHVSGDLFKEKAVLSFDVCEAIFLNHVFFIVIDNSFVCEPKARCVRPGFLNSFKVSFQILLLFAFLENFVSVGVSFEHYM